MAQTEGKKSLSVELAGAICRRTMESEMHSEVDFDPLAMLEIEVCNARLITCWVVLFCRRAYGWFSEKRSTFHEAARKRGLGAEIAFLSSVGAMLPRYEEPEEEIGAAVEELKKCLGDPRKCCRNSRKFRYEVVCLYILGTLPNYKKELVAGILILRKIVFRFKGDESVRREYAQNIEMRLADIEAVYEMVFSVTFDRDKHVPTEGQDSVLNDEEYLRYLDNIQGDVEEVGTRLSNLSSMEAEFLSELELATEDMSSEQKDISGEVARTKETCNKLVSSVEMLDETLDSLDYAINDISDCAKRTRLS